jgi:hypothetical protein
LVTDFEIRIQVSWNLGVLPSSRLGTARVKVANVRNAIEARGIVLTIVHLGEGDADP